MDPDLQKFFQPSPVKMLLHFSINSLSHFRLSLSIVHSYMQSTLPSPFSSHSPNAQPNFRPWDLLYPVTAYTLAMCTIDATGCDSIIHGRAFTTRPCVTGTNAYELVPWQQGDISGRAPMPPMTLRGVPLLVWMLLVHWYGSLLFAHHHASATHLLCLGGTIGRFFSMYLMIH